jgi:hypothetical protein
VFLSKVAPECPQTECPQNLGHGEEGGSEGVRFTLEPR